jgi:hypothetical protein
VGSAQRINVVGYNKTNLSMDYNLLTSRTAEDRGRARKCAPRKSTCRFAGA